MLISIFSFGTACAVSADFRQAVISFLFPTYTENQLCEIDDGHRTGSFSMEDTLFIFLEKFNSEHVEHVVMERNDYKETTGLWQVIAYQILDSEIANEMIDNRQ